MVRSTRIELTFVRFHSFTKIQSDTRFATRLQTIGNFSERDLIFYQLGSNTQMIHNSAVISTNDMYLQIFSFRPSLSRIHLQQHFHNQKFVCQQLRRRAVCQYARNQSQVKKSPKASDATANTNQHADTKAHKRVHNLKIRRSCGKTDAVAYAYTTIVLEALIHRKRNCRAISFMSKNVFHSVVISTSTCRTRVS